MPALLGWGSDVVDRVRMIQEWFRGLTRAALALTMNKVSRLLLPHLVEGKIKIKKGFDAQL